MRLTRRTLLPAAALVAAEAEASTRPNEPGAVLTISLERTPCFGLCPEDRLQLRSDGTAEYTGIRGVELIGEYQGFVDPLHFRRLTRLLRRSGFFHMRERYEADATDLPSHITTASGRRFRKSVENYGDAGPDRLWVIETALLGIAATIRWEPVT